MPQRAAAVTVVIASDSFLLGDGLASLLATVPDVDVIGRAHSLNELNLLLAGNTPQVVIISIRSLVVTTEAIVTAVRTMRQKYPEMGLVVISDRVDKFALQLLQGGSSGVAFLLDEHLPGIEAIVGAVREICTGQAVLDPTVLDAFIRRGDAMGIDDLTKREVRILKGMAQGLSNRAIADELHVSAKTIEKGITAIFVKLGPFQQGLSDRRVSAALVYLRSQADPFGQESQQADQSFPAVLLEGADVAAGEGE